MITYTIYVGIQYFPMQFTVRCLTLIATCDVSNENRHVSNNWSFPQRKYGIYLYWLWKSLNLNLRYLPHLQLKITVKVVRGQKPRRTKAPKDRSPAILSARTEAPRSFKTYSLHFIIYFDHIFPIQQKLNKLCHTFGTMSINKACPQSD